MNRLAKETSPYLLQHAHNPVDWYPWGPEAFAKAKAEDKPIFLSVGYSSCYWCHVMERETFEDEATAKALNEHFVCIKVDREERPDVDAVYMAALQAFSGGGGWPMSMFLFPDGRPFFGGTYFPARQKNNVPGFDRLLVARPRRLGEAPGRPGHRRRPTSPRPPAGSSPPTPRPVPRSPGRWAWRGSPPWPSSSTPITAASASTRPGPARPSSPSPSNLVFLLDRARRKAEAPRGVDPRGDARHDARPHGPRRHPRPPGRRLPPLQRRSRRGPSRTSRRCSTTTPSSLRHTWKRSSQTGEPAGGARPRTSSRSSPGR